MKYKILITAHNMLEPNSGVGQITLSVKKMYEQLEIFDCTLLDHSSLRFLDERLRPLTFPIVVFLKVLLSHVRRDPYDLIHATTGDTAFLNYLPFASPLVVVQSHNIEKLSDIQMMDMGHKFSLRYRIFRQTVIYPLVHLSLKNATLVFVLSPFELDYIKNRYGEKAFLIQNTHNLATSYKSKSGNRVVTVGGDNHRKNISSVLRVFSQLRSRCSELELVVLGEEAEKVQHLLDSNEGITFIPKYSNKSLAGILEDCSIFVSLSKSEGFPIFLMEACSQGLVPVLSKIPSHIWFSEQSPFSILVDQSDLSVAQGVQAATKVSPAVRMHIVNWAAIHNRSSQMSIQAREVMNLLRIRDTSRQH